MRREARQRGYFTDLRHRLTDWRAEATETAIDHLGGTANTDSHNYERYQTPRGKQCTACKRNKRRD